MLFRSHLYPLTDRERARNAELLSSLSLSPAAYLAYQARVAPFADTPATVSRVGASADSIIGAPRLHRSTVFQRDFLVFDVELLFLYPWAVASRSDAGIDAAVHDGLVSSRGLVFAGAMLFIALVIVGFAYDWRKGVFRWR